MTFDPLSELIINILTDENKTDPENHLFLQQLSSAAVAEDLPPKFNQCTHTPVTIRIPPMIVLFIKFKVRCRIGEGEKSDVEPNVKVVQVFCY